MFGRFGPRYATSRNVTFQEDTVLKTVDPRFAEVEVRVTQAAYDLARKSELFNVPRILSYDLTAGVIEFERVMEYVTLGHLIARTPGNLEVIQRIGKALACIHTQLQLPSCLRIPVDAKWMTSDDDMVPIHGDFNTINVGLDENTNAVTVMDWASASGLDRKHTVGPVYLDLAHFVYSLFIHQASHINAMMSLKQRTNVFLDVYQSESGRKIDLSVLADFLLRLNEVLAPGLTERRGVLRCLYYSSICSVGDIVFDGLARQWRKDGKSSKAR